jgi:transposase-like protein
VEIDETYIGQDEESVRGRKTERKALVVIAAEEDETRIGRVRMQRIEDASSENLEPFILSSVKPGSVISTDGWKGYAGVKKLGYEHEVMKIKDSGQKAHELMPLVHRVASLLKRWLLGTLQGSVSHEHLDYYLDEFTFRFNRRTSQSRGKLFYRLVQQAVAVEPIPYKRLIGGKPEGKAET